MENKDSATALKALKKMFTRPYLNEPHASITTDQGTEFSGVFNDYLYDQSIFHKVTRVGRHQQLGNIDSLIKQLGRLFNGLMNKQEMKTGKVSKAWIKYIPVVRDGLNKARLKKLPDDYNDDYEYPPLTLPTDKKNNIIKNKYKIGDLVHVGLDRPENALGKKQTGKFRTGDNRFDPKPREITKVLYYNGKNTYRYLVKGVKNASYAESDIFLAS
jgi:Tfp pilus assembly protein PilX